MTATYVNLGSNGQLTQVAPAVVGGSANAGDIVALNSSGVLDATMMPSGTGVDAVTATASVAISAGNFVNLYNNAGVLSMKLADCSTGLQADGYVLAAVASGSTGTVYLNNQNTAQTGLTPGTIYFLSTAGGISATPPTTAGYLNQVVGKSVSATSLQFRPEQPVTLA